MKSYIRKILKEERGVKSRLEKLNSSSLKNVAYKLIDKYVNDDYFNWSFEIEGMINHFSTILGLDYQDVSFLIFSYLMEQDEDPTYFRNLSDWLYRVASDEILEFLKLSGYYSDYMNYNNFSDINFSEEGKIYFDVDEYQDFAEWFDNESLASRVFEEDWLDLFDSWGDDFSDIISNLNNDTIRYVVDVIASENEYISDLEERDTWSEIISENGELHLTPDNIEYIKKNIDSEDLSYLIIEGGLTDVEHEIRNAWNTAYNSASEDELFEHLKSEIEDFMESKIEYTDSGIRIDVTNRFTELFDMYILESHYNPVSEHFNFLDMLTKLFDDYISKLDVGNIDYYHPDNSKVSETFNYMIKDYL